MQQASYWLRHESLEAALAYMEGAHMQICEYRWNFQFYNRIFEWILFVIVFLLFFFPFKKSASANIFEYDDKPSQRNVIDYYNLTDYGKASIFEIKYVKLNIYLWTQSNEELIGNWIKKFVEHKMSRALPYYRLFL